MSQDDTPATEAPCKRVLIMSSERSGSNLLRSILGSHSQLASPIAIHYTSHLAPYAMFYGDLTDPARQRVLAEDLLELAYLHIYPWEVELTVDDVLAHLTRPGFWGVVDATYRAYAAAEGKTGWVCKDNHLFDHAVNVMAQVEDVHILYLVRDGRDVACSYFKVAGGPKTIGSAARMWKRDQRTATDVHNNFAPRGRSMLVRYEDLVNDPVAMTQAVCDFLGLPYEEAMLAFHTSALNNSMAESSAYWKNLSKPISNKSVGRYRTTLSAQEIARYERIAGPELALLGYDVATSDFQLRPSLSDRVVETIDEVISRGLQRWSLSRKGVHKQWLPKDQAAVQLQRRLISRARDVDLTHQPRRPTPGE